METALIAALISTTVALLIFAAGRWHDTRVKQTDFLRSKLEELWLALHEINVNSTILDIPPAIDLGELRKILSVRTTHLILAINTPSMLARLYFPDALPRVNQLAKATIRVHGWLMKYADSGDFNTAGGGDAEYRELVAATDNLKTFLQDNQHSLTKKIGHGG